MSQTALREFVRTYAENRPAVYQMLGEDGHPLYVGKSVRVRSRLLSYFRAAPKEKASKLIREAVHIRWEYVPNEFAALVREMKLIQRWHPRFNVQHRRKRAYAFVKITAERAPRVIPVTRVVADGSTYFGPFPAVDAVARIVRELAHAIGLRDCPGTTPVFFGDQLEIFSGGRLPLCMRADLGSCLAPCCGRITSEDYLAKVRATRRFLEGKSDAPLQDLEARMEEASDRMDFEYAALLRDRIERFGAFRTQLAAFRGRVESLSFVYRVPGFNGDDRIYLIRRGRIRKELRLPTGSTQRIRTAKAVERVFSSCEKGLVALRPLEAAEILLVARWFRLNPKELRRTTPPEKWRLPCPPRHHDASRV
ncbi:MAG: UvrB/UvrC motif-containing protein [Longimicrobiales bacterium]